MVFSGRVTDKQTGNAIPFASVKIFTDGNEYTGVGVSADANGEFKLSNDVAQWPNYALISAAEFEPVMIELYEDWATGYNYSLVRKVKELDPVIVTSDGNKDKKNLAWLLLIPLAVAATNNKGKKVGDVGFNMPTVLTAGAALLVFKGFDVLSNIFSFLGLGKDKEDQAAGNDASNPDSPLKGKLYVNAAADKKTAAFNSLVSDPNGSNNKVNRLAETLISSFGGWNDDEAQAIGVFKTFRTQIEASCFAYIWTDVWGYPDLNEWLRGDAYPNDRLSNDEIADIISYLKNLPKY